LILGSAVVIVRFFERASSFCSSAVSLSGSLAVGAGSVATIACCGSHDPAAPSACSGGITCVGSRVLGSSAWPRAIDGARRRSARQHFVRRRTTDGLLALRRSVSIGCQDWQTLTEIRIVRVRQDLRETL